MKILMFTGYIPKLVLLFLIGFLFCVDSCKCDTSKDIVIHNAINELHKELDDNEDGEVDVSEASEFAQDTLKYTPSAELSDRFKNHITKDKLWQSWKTSEAYNWTVDDVIVWLTVHIDLPEYTQVFTVNNISGSTIPRLALADMSFLLNNLRIINSEHRQKIALNSKELILFGIPRDIENKFSKDKQAFEAIKQLHAQLDDDEDGGVDPQEANEFVRDELKDTTDIDRAKDFNKNDNHISREELWRNWKSSEVFNWTVPDVLEWLISQVELSEYTDVFQSNQVNGSIIPRLALSDMSFLIKDLKIKNPVHRKKILLKSTDLILFGPPKNHHSVMKDTILLTLVIVTIGGCWLAFTQHRYSKKQLKNMQDKMNQLGKAEESLCKLQNKLEEAEIQNTRVTTEKMEIEEKLKSEIEKFKEEIIRTDSNEDLYRSRQIDDNLFNQLNLDQNFSQNLKILLQMTYEVEGHFFSVKRLAAEQQLRNVREMCEKLRRKKSTFIGSLKMAHSGNLDDMDKQLSEAKHSVDEVRSDLNERSQRWECLEKLLRFKIFPTPGLATLRSSFKFNNSTGIAYRKHSIAASSSALCSQLSPSNSSGFISSTVVPGYKNHNSSCSVVRPKSLKFYTGSCSGDCSDVVETPSSYSNVEAVPDLTDDNHQAQTSLPKTCSVSSSLFHMCTVPSEHGSLSNHHSTVSTIGHRKSSFASLTSDVDHFSKSNLNCHMTQVRPFAFRWLKKLDKSKLTFKKSKQIL